MSKSYPKGTLLGYWDPEIPDFLVRDPNTNESEYTRMTPYLPTAVFGPATETASPKPNGKAKPPKAVAAKAATVKAAPKAPAKAAAKPAKAAKAEKATKVAKVAKGAKPKATRNADPAKLDQFGLRIGSLKSKAAEMYADKGGATLAEVKEALDSVQFNVLTMLREKGFTITEKQEDGNGHRRVTRYFLKAK